MPIREFSAWENNNSSIIFQEGIDIVSEDLFCFWCFSYSLRVWINILKTFRRVICYDFYFTLWPDALKQRTNCKLIYQNMRMVRYYDQWSRFRNIFDSLRAHTKSSLHFQRAHNVRKCEFLWKSIEEGNHLRNMKKIISHLSSQDFWHFFIIVARDRMLLYILFQWNFIFIHGYC